MAVLVLGVGTLILVYCARYFTDDEPRLGIFAAEMVAFAGAMFGLVTSDNMLLLYVFWELTTVLSFLLVGHYARTRHQPPRRDPGTAGHHRGWSGDVGRHDHPRPGRRQLQPVRTGREPADGGGSRPSRSS